MLIVFNKINEFIFRYYNNNIITKIAVNTSFHSLVGWPPPLLALALLSLPFTGLSNIDIFSFSSQVNVQCFKKFILFSSKL